MTLSRTVSEEVGARGPGMPVVLEAHGLVNGPDAEGSSALLNSAARSPGSPGIR